jgi:hypothetical protein
VGSDGSILLLSSGAETGAVNPSAPELQLPDWSADTAALQAHVHAYFVDMGIEPCQIADRGISAGGDGRTVNLDRVIDGIRVQDSNAFARFVSSDETTSEGLYWPTIPAEVVSAARAFKNELMDPQKLAAYKAKLPPEAQGGDGQIVIRHSTDVSDKPFRAGVEYFVYEPGPTYAGFDMNGIDTTLNWD